MLYCFKLLKHITGYIMKKIAIIILFSLLCGNVFAVPVDPAKLTKVTDENNPKCVEYYTYQSEMYCSTKALSPEPSDPNIKNYETQKLIFDDRVWKPAWGKKTDNLSMVEYVPSGDDIDHWNELVTSQFIPGLSESTPKELADAALKGISEAGFSPIIKFYEESPTLVVFEFRILNPENQRQDELQIIRKTKDGFYIVHYVVKKSDMGDKARELWLGNLREAKVK